MAYLKQQRPEKVTVPSLRASKERGERLVCLTAYDYPTARVVDEAGIDIILVGDSLGNVVLGYDNTVPVTIEDMLVSVRAVRRAVQRALLVADMPYGSYHTGADDAVRAALRLIKEGGAEALKLEGGLVRASVVKRLVSEEIPVMGHIGLTPQSVHKLGGFRLQGKTARSSRSLIDDALALEEAGAFALVLEMVPREVAKAITEGVKIPTIGIGAGPHCDAQVLVVHDLVGLSLAAALRFVRQYADLRAVMTDAVTRFAEDVRGGDLPV
ncbi:MAG: 3-methyl-2-oxobutanoate hydroxymethyltransferase [Pyrinomonadaceae bacterium]